MRCKHKYYRIDKDGQLVCSVCGEPAPGQPEIEDKQEDRHETKERTLYVSDKDKAEAAKAGQIWPPESKRIGRR